MVVFQHHKCCSNILFFKCFNLHLNCCTLQLLILASSFVGVHFYKHIYNSKLSAALKTSQKVGYKSTEQVATTHQIRSQWYHTHLLPVFIRNLGIVLRFMLQLIQQLWSFLCFLIPCFNGSPKFLERPEWFTIQSRKHLDGLSTT